MKTTRADGKSYLDSALTLEGPDGERFVEVAPGGDDGEKTQVEYARHDKHNI